MKKQQLAAATEENSMLSAKNGGDTAMKTKMVITTKKRDAGNRSPLGEVNNNSSGGGGVTTTPRAEADAALPDDLIRLNKKVESILGSGTLTPVDRTKRSQRTTRNLYHAAATAAEEEEERSPDVRVQSPDDSYCHEIVLSPENNEEVEEAVGGGAAVSMDARKSVRHAMREQPEETENDTVSEIHGDTDDEESDEDEVTSSARPDAIPGGDLDTLADMFNMKTMVRGVDDEVDVFEPLRGMPKYEGTHVRFSYAFEGGEGDGTTSRTTHDGAPDITKANTVFVHRVDKVEALRGVDMPRGKHTRFD